MDNNTHVSTPESSSIPSDAPLGVLSDITNLSAAELRRKRATERYVLLSVEDKEVRNKKAREKRQQKKEDSQGDNQSATTADGIETRQPMITPRRLSFTVRNGVAHYDDIENNEGPLSCIVQRASQDSLKLDFVRDKSATKSSHEAMDNDPMIMENTRVGASQSLTEEQLEWRRARDRFNYAALTPEHKQAILDRRRSQRQSMTVEQRQEMNARRRVVRQSLQDVEIHDICVPYKGDESDLDSLIDTVFPNLNDNLTDPNYIISRAILSTRNEYVDRINMKMIGQFHGEVVTYHSFDRAEDDPLNYYPLEFLNSLTPNGLPPHMLKLKINCPVILLRNIDPANRLCNGTRLVVRGFGRNAIDAEIVVGQHVGKRVFLPWIPLCPSDDEMFPFRFKMKQFPVRLSFALTINKAQGQTISNAGIYLPEPLFSHGQLYVALSRATSRTNIKILSMPVEEKKQKKRSKCTGVKDNEKKRKELSEQTATYTKNIVYREVLTD